MKSSSCIETATPKEIAEYLDYLRNTAWEKAGHKTGEEDGEYEAYEIWKKLYEFVFSENISNKIYDRFGELDYYDPDGSYYEDVTAYIDAFKDFAEDCNEVKMEPIMFPSFEEYKQIKSKSDYC